MRQFLKMALSLAATFAFGMAAVSAQAGSSSASSAGSESLGSSSTSIEKSSDSSSGNDKFIQGQYKVIDMAEIALRPNMIRVRLQALAPVQTREFFLTLPRQAAERGQLAAGEIVEVEQRPYGLAFATVNATGNTKPFFLVLEDDWYRELRSRPVAL